MSLPANPVYAAVLCADKDSSVRLSDRMAGARHILGAGFETAVGTFADELIAAAWPAVSEPDYDRILAAMLAAYRPRVVIGAGFSISASDQARLGTSIVADRVVGPEGDSLRFVGPDSRMPGSIKGTLSEPTTIKRDDTLASNNWCHQFAAACTRLEQPAAVVTVVNRDPDEPVGKEAAHVLRQRSAAARAGAIVRATWRKPTSLLELLNRKSHGLEYQELLADAIASVLRTPAYSGS